MSDMIQQAVQHVSEQVSKEGASVETPGQKPSSDDLATFNQAMQGGGDKTQGVNTATQVDQANQGYIPQQTQDVAGAVDPGKTPSLGETILNGMKKIDSDIKAQKATVDQDFANVSGKNVTVVDMIKMQQDMAAYSLQQDLLSKGVDKMSQSVQTLFKT